MDVLGQNPCFPRTLIYSNRCPDDPDDPVLEVLPLFCAQPGTVSGLRAQEQALECVGHCGSRKK